jgi:molybdopterin/thiamine biosynthesis adenylyltransferase
LFNHDGRLITFRFLEQDELNEFAALIAGETVDVRSPRVREFIAANPQLFDQVSELALASLTVGRLSRQIAYLSQYSDLDQAVATMAFLEDATVILLGIGGIGSHIADHLVRLGVKRFILVDPDRVEESNLNRQILYSASDMGQLKRQVAERRMTELGGHTIHAHTFDSFAEAKSYLFNTGAQPSIIFVSADDSPFSLRRDVISYAFPRAVPYCFAGYLGTRGIISPAVFRPSNVCGSCVVMGGETESWMHDLAHHKLGDLSPSAYSINAVVAALAIEQWIRNLVDEHSDAFEMRISMRDFSITKTTLIADPTCPICGSRHE